MNFNAMLNFLFAQIQHQKLENSIEASKARKPCPELYRQDVNNFISLFNTNGNDKNKT